MENPHSFLEPDLTPENNNEKIKAEKIRQESSLLINRKKFHNYLIVLYFCTKFMLPLLSTAKLGIFVFNIEFIITFFILYFKILHLIN